MSGSEGPHSSAVNVSEPPQQATPPTYPPGSAESSLGPPRRHLLIAVVLLVGLAGWIFSADAASSIVDALLGVLTALVVYVLCLRYGVWTWLAAVAAAPTAWTLGRLGVETTPAGQPILAVLICSALLFALWSMGSDGGPRTLPPLRVVVGLVAMIAPFVWWAARRSFAGDLAEQATPAVLQGLLVVALVLGLAAAVGLGRADTSGMRWACWLTTLAPVGVLWATTTNGHPQWHDQLVIALLPTAGVLGLTAMLRGRRGPAVDRPQLDDVDRLAIADFAQRYSDPQLAPVAIVIAAYNEENGLPEVLATMPRTICGLAADVIVVDDKSTDATAEVVRGQHDVYLVAPDTNRGQGSALRLGYRIARTHGAEYVITTDADGQYDPADMATVLAPIVDDRADFVTGSRRRGHQETHDRFRKTGVYVFAWIIAAMTGKWTTDTSFGLRAMRAEMTAHLTLNQPQYQASELLLGAHSHGYRVLEVPGRMRIRSAGTTKKGRNAVYGKRYAGVVFATWWREGCPTPVTEHAPALTAMSPVRSDQSQTSAPTTSAPSWVRRNLPFLIAFGLAVVVRLVVMAAYSPGFIHSDARAYLPLMDDLVPLEARPVGYGVLLLKPVSWVTHDVTLVVSIQHLMGLATAVILCALMRRWGVRSWVATLAVLPVLFDAMQLVLEHTVLSDVLFNLLVAAGIAALAWRRELNIWLVFGAGLLLGTSVTVRVVAQPLVLAAVIFCLLLGTRWRTRIIASVAVVAGFLIPIGAYATWYHSEHGKYALTEFAGQSLYLRTTTFVDCQKLDLPDYQLALCPVDPVGERHDPTWYVFSKSGNLKQMTIPEGVDQDQMLREFAMAAIEAQPGDYASTVVRDFLLNFKIDRRDYYDYETSWKWSFDTWNARDVRTLDKPFYPQFGGELQAHQPWSKALVEYEKYIYLAGPLLLGCLVMALAGMILPRRNGPRGLRAVIFLFAASGAGLLLVPDVTAEFVWRYQLPGLMLIPVAAAFAYTSLRREDGAGQGQAGTVATASTD